MLSKAESRFITSWKDQREGPVWKFYLQYILAWTIVSFLSLFFLLKLVMDDRSMGGWKSFYIVLAASLLIGTVTTHMIYQNNERKLKKILEREQSLN